MKIFDFTAYHEYPQTYPQPLRAVYGNKIDFVASDVQMESGWTRNRRLSPYKYTSVALAFEMSTSDFHKWHTWMNQYGFHWFVMPLQNVMTDATAEPYTSDNAVRLISAVQYRYLNFNRIEASVQAELIPLIADGSGVNAGAAFGGGIKDTVGTGAPTQAASGGGGVTTPPDNGGGVIVPPPATPPPVGGGGPPSTGGIDLDSPPAAMTEDIPVAAYWTFKTKPNATDSSSITVTRLNPEASLYKTFRVWISTAPYGAALPGTDFTGSSASGHKVITTWLQGGGPNDLSPSATYHLNVQFDSWASFENTVRVEMS